MPAEPIKSPPIQSSGSVPAPAQESVTSSAPASSNQPVLSGNSVIVESEQHADPHDTKSTPGKAKPRIEPPAKKFNLLEMRKMAFDMQLDNALVQLKTSKDMSESMIQINDNASKQQLEKLNEQLDKQRQSDQKSGFLGIFSKIFDAITVVVGVALIATGVGAGFGVGLLVGFAVGKILEIDAIKNAIVKGLSAVFGEQLGNIIAAALIVGVQVALAIKSGNIGSALAKTKSIATLAKTVSNVVSKTLPKVFAGARDTAQLAQGLKTTNTVVQSTGGMIKGGTVMAQAKVEYEIAGLREKVSNLTSEIGFIENLIQMAITTQSQRMAVINQNFESSMQGIRDTSDILQPKRS